MDDLLLGSSAIQGAAIADSGRFEAELDHLTALSKRSPEKMDDRGLREVAKRFESLFVRLLLKEMRKTIPQDGFLDYSHATQMYQEMGDDALADQVAEMGGVGVGELLYQQLKETRDSLFTAQEIAERQDQFFSVHRPDGEAEHSKFIPLKKESEAAAGGIPLRKEGEFIPLPQKGGFIPFQAPVIPLDKVERR